MPRGDKSGPNSEGPMTGRAMGYCAGFNYAGFENNQTFGCKRGFGYGRGRGFGRGNGLNQRRFFTTPQEMINQNKEPSKKEILKELKANKARIEKAIKEIEQKKNKE